jgi:DNA-directed RNA polymerase specialized sigma24 family protein
VAGRNAIIAEIPRLRRYARALAQLPVEQREVLLLVALEGLSYKEVAVTLLRVVKS